MDAGSISRSLGVLQDNQHTTHHMLTPHTHTGVKAPASPPPPNTHTHTTTTLRVHAPHVTYWVNRLCSAADCCCQQVGHVEVALTAGGLTNAHSLVSHLRGGGGGMTGV
jgi:hypothetical protein